MTIIRNFLTRWRRHRWTVRYWERDGHVLMHTRRYVCEKCRMSLGEIPPKRGCPGTVVVTKREYEGTIEVGGLPTNIKATITCCPGSPKQHEGAEHGR